MASLLRFLFFISILISFAHSSTIPLSQDNVKIIKPFYNIASLCADQRSIYASNRKLICILCKGFDPSCFSTSSSTTSTTPTSATTSSSTPASTTTTTAASSTIPSTTTSSTTSTERPTKTAE